MDTFADRLKELLIKVKINPTYITRLALDLVFERRILSLLKTISELRVLLLASVLADVG